MKHKASLRYMHIFKVQDVLKRALKRYSKCYCVASVTKTFILKGVDAEDFKDVERWIACTPLSINFFVTLVSQ
jgi:hypothetical protein